MATGLRAWVDRVSARPLPVWRQSRLELLRLAGQGGYNAAALTRGVAHDPLLCAQLLRLANSGRAGGSIATLPQGAVLLGARALARFAAALPVLEDSLPDAELQALRQLQRHAFHVGYLARALSHRLRAARHEEDAFYAGLLRELGEFARRACPLPASAEAELPASLAGAERATRSAALARHWRLPPLLQACTEERARSDRAAALVDLAAALVRGGAEPLRELEAQPLRRLSTLLGEPAEPIRTAVFAAATEAASWLVGRLPARDHDLLELYPEPPPAG